MQSLILEGKPMKTKWFAPFKTLAGARWPCGSTVFSIFLTASFAAPGELGPKRSLNDFAHSAAPSTSRLSLTVIGVSNPVEVGTANEYRLTRLGGFGVGVGLGFAGRSVHPIGSAIPVSVRRLDRRDSAHPGVVIGTHLRPVVPVPRGGDGEIGTGMRVRHYEGGDPVNAGRPEVGDRVADGDHPAARRRRWAGRRAWPTTAHRWPGPTRRCTKPPGVVP